MCGLLLCINVLDHERIYEKMKKSKKNNENPEKIEKLFRELVEYL
jgi:hypothetical protein